MAASPSPEPPIMTFAPGYPRLVGDVGGTHARFASVVEPGGPLSTITRYRCADFASLLDAMRHWLAAQAGPAPRACALGVATAITGDQVRLTNHPWQFSIRQLQAQLGVERLLVLNDFSALAWSLPVLPASALRQIGGGQAVPGAALGLIGPGTGLGVSGLLSLPGSGEQVVVDGEGGHITLAAGDPHEAELLRWLHQRFGHASAERALSGPGLENLYQAVRAIAGRPAEPRAAPAITEAALAGHDDDCVQALTVFCSLLGNLAGNTALTLGARGGVYIGGGIVQRLGPWFDRSPFRQRFEAKGRFGDYLRAVPTFVLQAGDSPALIGASRALDRLAA
ncbi:MAG: glucokinase [Burkholderiales bacterium]|nr:glucokinase [Burkholderiales bacterium]